MDSDTDVEGFEPLLNADRIDFAQIKNDALDLALDFVAQTPNFAVVLTYRTNGCNCSPHFTITTGEENALKGRWGASGSYPITTYMPFIVPGSVDTPDARVSSYPRAVTWTNRADFDTRARHTLLDAGGPHVWIHEDIALRPLDGGNWTFLYEASHDCDSIW